MRGKQPVGVGGVGAEDPEQLLRGAFEDAPIGMALVGVEDDAGLVLRVNQALCALLGRDAPEIEHHEVASIIHPDDVASDREAMAHLLAGEIDGYQLEQRMLYAGGRAVWVMLHVSLVRDQHGQPLYCIRQLEDIEERRRFEGELGYLADHDSLTGLANRRGFLRELNRQIAHVRRYGGSAGVLFIDIDDFKHINDAYGHNVGDEVIVSVAQAIRSRLRETDMVARLGGDEFAVLLPRADIADAETLASSLLAALQNGVDDSLADCFRGVSASIGVTTFSDPDPDVDGDDILGDADMAMYSAKDAGKNRVEVASDGDVALDRSRVTWAQRVRRAVNGDQFELYTQPIVDLSTDEIAHWELLLRMPGEDAEMILPAQFLYSAERSGLIQVVDRWVLSQAIGLLAEHGSAGPGLKLSVNLSARSVGDIDLPGFIEQALSDQAVDPSRLVLEVAETAAIANMDRARKFAVRLSQVGCRFALDDFGAGFGSFYYLKYLPFDYIKIDGEFIRNLPASRTDQLILDSIVRMCKGLGKLTVGEFVGDQQTVEVLKVHGVDFAQGYHVGRPQPLAEAFQTSRLPR
jgi:diguanylate cyclase (GGDEF)-like protein/PAS domain S-box-containing protein